MGQCRAQPVARAAGAGLGRSVEGIGWVADKECERRERAFSLDHSRSPPQLPSRRKPRCMPSVSSRPPPSSSPHTPSSSTSSQHPSPPASPLSLPPSFLSSDPRCDAPDRQPSVLLLDCELSARASSPDAPRKALSQRLLPSHSPPSSPACASLHLTALHRAEVTPWHRTRQPPCAFLRRM